MNLISDAARGPSMAALVKDETSCSVRRVAAPRAPGPREVVVRVAYAGLCRTDLYAAEGRLPTSVPVVLGHEGSGIVHAAGPRTRLRPGEPVTILPRVACGACPSCAAGLGPLDCDAPRRLGLDEDGVFAEYVKLPEASAASVP